MMVEAAEPISPLKRSASAESLTDNTTHGLKGKPKHLRPFDTKEIKVLLLENVHQTAVDALKNQGMQMILILRIA
jgi:D-3-phosphoglycerate dehydrogenase